MDLVNLATDVSMLREADVVVHSLVGFCFVTSTWALVLAWAAVVKEP